MVYDENGIVISPSVHETFANNMHLDYDYDESSNANFTVIRIYKDKLDESKQYPFVYVPNGSGAGTKSTLQMNREKGFPLAINGGTFNMSTLKPVGLVIQNGVLIQQETGDARIYPLTINSNGELGYTTLDADPHTLINNGIISVLSGWAPCIIDYEDALEVIPSAYDDQTNAQRQILGQFGNGDYAVITCEGRNFNHSDGWTMTEAKAICKDLGLKFAYNLDGGGSTQTVLGNKQINIIYEGTYGRIIPSYIVFNGTDQFKEGLNT